MAELQLLTALLTMHKLIGDILEAAQHEGGTIDVFEIQARSDPPSRHCREGTGERLPRSPDAAPAAASS